MSSCNTGGAGAMGGNGGLPEGITQAQLDEIKSFNAGLTQAGNKTRSSKSRGGGVNRGRGSGILPGRGGGYGGSSHMPRSGSGIGYGANSSYTVGPSTSSPIAKPVPREQVPIHLRGRVDITKTRWANVDVDSTGAGILQGHKIGSINSASTPPKTRSRSPTRNSIMVAQPPPHLIQMLQADPSFQCQISLQNIPDLQASPVVLPPGRGFTPPGRTRIVSNMTPDDPSKPFIPAHLHQTSCRVAIEEISRMIGLPLSEVTSNGISIPATRPRDQAENVTSPTIDFAAVTILPQAEVIDREDWLKMAENKKPNTQASMVADIPNMQPMLSESRWAPEAKSKTPQNGFAASFPALNAPTASAPVASASANGHIRVPSYSMMDVEMTGAASILDTPVPTDYNTSRGPMNEVLISMPTLAVSRWASPNASTNHVALGTYSQASATSHVPAATGVLAASYAPPTAQVAAATHVSSVPHAPAAPNVPGGPSTNGGPPLTESGGNKWPSIQDQWAAWGFPPDINEIDIPPPTRSFLHQKVTLGNQIIPGFTPIQRRRPPPDHVATHQRNLLANPNPPPSWSTENVAPVSTSSPPKKEEKKVAYLKDSRWAC